MDSVLSDLLQKHIHACQIQTVFKFLFPKLSDALFAQKQMYRDNLIRASYFCQLSLSGCRTNATTNAKYLLYPSFIRRVLK